VGLCLIRRELRISSVAFGIERMRFFTVFIWVVSDVG
jgi:hypothetical protein